MIFILGTYAEDWARLCGFPQLLTMIEKIKNVDGLAEQSTDLAAE